MHGDQDKMEDSSRVALGNHTVRSGEEDREGEVRCNVLPYVQICEMASGLLPCLPWPSNSLLPI